MVAVIGLGFGTFVTHSTHICLENISWMGLSLSVLRPIYLAKSNDSDVSFHLRNNLKALKRSLHGTHVTTH